MQAAPRAAFQPHLTPYVRSLGAMQSCRRRVAAAASASPGTSHYPVTLRRLKEAELLLSACRAADTCSSLSHGAAGASGAVDVPLNPMTTTWIPEDLGRDVFRHYTQMQGIIDDMRDQAPLMATVARTAEHMPPKQNADKDWSWDAHEWSIVDLLPDSPTRKNVLRTQRRWSPSKLEDMRHELLPSYSSRRAVRTRGKSSTPRHLKAHGKRNALFIDSAAAAVSASDDLSPRTRTRMGSRFSSTPVANHNNALKTLSCRVLKSRCRSVSDAGRTDAPKSLSPRRLSTPEMKSRGARKVCRFPKSAQSYRSFRSHMEDDIQNDGEDMVMNGAFPLRRSFVDRAANFMSQLPRQQYASE